MKKELLFTLSILMFVILGCKSPDKVVDGEYHGYWTNQSGTQAGIATVLSTGENLVDIKITWNNGNSVPINVTNISVNYENGNYDVVNFYWSASSDLIGSYTGSQTGTLLLVIGEFVDKKQLNIEFTTLATYPNVNQLSFTGLKQ